MIFQTFLKLFKCEALEDFLISFLEIVRGSGCLGNFYFRKGKCKPSKAALACEQAH